MAKRIIPIEVRDEYILGAGRVIGAKGSHDDVALRVEFNEMWRGKSVTAVWLNAVGESPVVAPINFSNWEGSNPHICIIDIPAKAKSAVGDAMLTIRGFTSVDGETESTATLTATAYFKVLESDFDNEAEEEEEEDKLNLYQQLQNDIAALETTMSNAIVASKAAVDAKDDVLSAKEEIDMTKADIDSILVDCQSCADNAAASESNASTYAENAFGHMEAAAISAGAALGERQDAEKAQAAAEAAKMSAADSAKTANEAASEAADFSEAANDSANEAASSSTAASKSASAAAQSASAAAQSATQAAASASTAQSAASKAHSDVEAIQDTIDEFMDSGIEEAASAARGEVDRILAELEPPIDEAIGYANDAAASADRAYREAERAEDAADRAEAAGGVSKGYVDEELEKKLDKTGGTLTGDLNIGSADINVENGNVGVADLFSNWSALNAGNIKMVTDEGTVTLSPAGGLTFEDTLGNKKSIGGISYIEEIDPNAVTYSDMEEYVEEYVAANGGGVSEEYVNEELAKKFDKTGGTMSDEEGLSETTLSPYGVEIEDIDLRSQAKFDISGVHFTVSTDEGKVAGGGRISGLMDATLDHEAVPYGQMKAELDVVKTSVGEGKALIASAVTDKGVTTADDATFAQMAANIAAIESGGVELPELANEGASADLRKDKELINGEGEVVIGTMETFNGSYECSDDGTGGIKPIIDSLDITPTATDRTYDATEEGLDGYSPVVVRGDGNLAPENIVEGVSIFGVTGTAKTDVEPNLQDIDITPSHESRIYNASDGYDGFGEVYVNGEPNLVPENVVEGVKIFDVTGTAKTGGGGDDEYKETLIGVLDRTATNPVLPDGLTSIGDYVFNKYTNLALTSLPSGITSIGDYAFYECKRMALTSLPSGITSIGDYAFHECTNLALTSLPSGITSIGDYAFYNCTNLALTSLPSGITSIARYAFRECINLALTSLPSGITSIGDSAFYKCTNLALTSLPSGITSIGRYALYNCANLALTSLPSGITSIGDSAFYNCANLALTSLPSGITSIGRYAFCNCTRLANITFEGKPTTIRNNAFSGCTNLTAINVPWAEGEVADAPWGATNATINYNYTGG